MSLLKTLSTSKTIRRIVFPVLTLAIISAGFNCSKKSTNPPEDLENKLSENTIVVDENAQNFSYDNGRLVFSESSELKDFSVGDIVVTGVSPKTPNGFLRKIDSISVDKKIIHTSQASLTDALENANVSFSKEFSYSDIASSSFKEGILFKPSTASSFDFELSADSILLHDLDGDTITTKNDQFRMNAGIFFDVGFGFDFNIKKNPIGLNYLKFGANIKENSFVEVFSSDSVYSFLTEKKIGSIDFSPLTFWIPTLPPFPVVIKPGVDFYIGAQGDIQFTKFLITQNANLTAGVEYQNSWKPYVTFSNNFDFVSPTLLREIEVKGFAGPRFEALLYGLSGPELRTDAYAQLFIDLSNYFDLKLHGGLEASIGVDMELFGKTIADYHANLLNFDTLLYSYQYTPSPLVAKLTATPDSGTAPLEVLLDASQSSGEEIIEYKFNFGDGVQYTETKNSNDGMFDGKTKHTYSAVGQFTSKVIIKDDLERAATDSIFITTNDVVTPPIAHLLATPSQGQIPLSVLFDASSSTGEIVNYLFTSGDGQTHNEQKNDTAFDGKHSFIYSLPGEYFAKVEVKDDLERIAGDSVKISVEKKPLDSLMQLTTQGENISPDVSSDGEKIVFCSNRDGEEMELYSMDIDGLNKKRLTTTSSSENNPSYSPDGSMILYEKNYRLYVTNSNGVGETDVSPLNVLASFMPNWSPTGDQLTFVVTTPGGLYVNRKISIKDLYSSNYSAITGFPNSNYSGPDWNPKTALSSGIIFYGPKNGNNEIMKVTSDYNLSNNPADDIDPAWSPDGTKIAFSSNRTGDYDLYLMNADGTNQINITNTFDHNETSPSWFPSGKRLVFVKDNQVHSMKLPDVAKR